VRLTDFWGRMERAFGASYADSLARDQVVAELGGRTVHEAIEAGEDPKEVWRLVAAHFDVPARLR
jgi:hypothetical protein